MVDELGESCHILNIFTICMYVEDIRGILLRQIKELALRTAVLLQVKFVFLHIRNSYCTLLMSKTIALSEMHTVIRHTCTNFMHTIIRTRMYIHTYIHTYICIVIMYI